MAKMCLYLFKKLKRIFTRHFCVGVILGYTLYFFLTVNMIEEDYSVSQHIIVSEQPKQEKEGSEVGLQKYGPLNENYSDNSFHAPLKISFSRLYNISDDHDNLTELTPNEGQARILCWVMTYPAAHVGRALHIGRTWGKRCNKLLFMTTKPDARMEAVVLQVNESPWNMRRKTQEAWKHIYKNYARHYDWFLAVEDDTYVVMDNLHAFLLDFDSSTPLAFGHMMVEDGYQFLSRRPAYVLSRNSVNRLVANGINDGENKKCGSISWSYDDIAMGKCLDSVGVQQMDTRDSLGQLRFIPLPLLVLFSQANEARIQKREYWSSYSFKPFNQGLDSCSEFPIAFHEMNARRMYTLEYFIYHLQAFGIRTGGNGSENILETAEEIDNGLEGSMPTLIP